MMRWKARTFYLDRNGTEHEILESYHTNNAEEIYALVERIGTVGHWDKLSSYGMFIPAHRVLLVSYERLPE